MSADFSIVPSESKEDAAIASTVSSTTAEVDNLKRPANIEEVEDLGPDKKKQKIKINPSPNIKGKQRFIGIHLGAGTHSQKLNADYKNLCKTACETGLRILKKGGSANEAAVAATVILENSGLVNAGKGSNLTLEGTVECDAGFMNGEGFFGGVGAVSGVPNPILIAHKLAELQDPVYELSCGRVPPTFLVGYGAVKWAKSHSIPTCAPDALVSKKALKRHAKYMKKVENAAAKETNVILSKGVSDTVGVIALDHRNNVAATVSSGGNWLKYPGRVGHAPQFGCWALKGDQKSVAVSTTGIGESLAKVQWASQCGKLLQNEQFSTPVEVIASAIKDHYLESDLLRHPTKDKVAGMIGLTWDGHRGEFVYGHASHSLVVAYGGSSFKRVKTVFSTLPTKKEGEETSYKVEAVMI